MTTDTTTARRTPGRAVIACSFMTMLAISVPNAYGAAVPAISEASGVGVGTVGQLATVHGLGAFVGLGVWVWASRRFPTRWVVGASIGTLLLGVLGVALNPVAARTSTGAASFGALAATVAVIGLAFGVTMVATNTVLANRSGSSRLLNTANGMYGVGAVALPVVVGVADLRAAALVSACLAAVTLPAVRAVPDLTGELRDAAAVVADRRAARRAAPSSSVDRSPRALGRRLWLGNGSRPWVWLFSVAIGVEIGTTAWAATHLVAVGVSQRRAALAVGGFFAAFTVARFAMGVLGDRWSRRTVVVASNLLAAVAAVAATAVPLPSVAWAVVGLGVGPVFGTSLAWLTAATGDPDGTRRMNVGGAVGAVLLPGLVGVLVGTVGPRVIPWVIAGFATAAAVLAATLPAADGRRPDRSGADASATT